MKSALRVVFVVLLLAGVGWGGRAIYLKVQASRKARGSAAKPDLPVAVEVAAVTRGRIRDMRTFSGTLEARTRVVVATKISGRIERVFLDMADKVARGQVIAELDDDEYVQEVAQAEADLAVARANQARAESALTIAERALERARALNDQGMESESQFDVARSEHLAQGAAVKVAKAQVARSESAAATARIRLGYTKVRATWSSEAGLSGAEPAPWVVAERYVQQGDTVAANAPLLAIVELNPITAVLFVSERDYALLQVGQEVKLTTEAYPGEEFLGRIRRISPVFRQSSRQARVELEVANAEERLKPGLFVRSRVVLREVADATIVPEPALIKRGGVTGVFLLNEAGTGARWAPVQVGISEGERVQVTGDGISGRVVTLGQQLMDESSKLTIPAAHAAEVSSAGRTQ